MTPSAGMRRAFSSVLRLFVRSHRRRNERGRTVVERRDAGRTRRVNRANKGGRVEMGLKICKDEQRVFFFEVMKGRPGKELES